MRKSIVITLIVGLLAGFSVLGMAADSTSSFDATVNETISITAPTVTNMTVDVGSTAEQTTLPLNYATTYGSNDITVDVVDDSTEGSTDVPSSPVPNLDVNIKGGDLVSYTTLVSGDTSSGPLTLKSGITADNTSFNVAFQLDANSVVPGNSNIGSPGTYIVTFTIVSTE